MSLRVFKYLSPFLIYVGAFAAFGSTGIAVWIPLLYAWIFIPAVELFMKPDNSNLTEAEAELARKNGWYDVLLYAMVPLQFLALWMFLRSITVPGLYWVDLLGRTMVMGLLCGVFGINVGHELGHRANTFEKTLARMLLLSSLYMHFFIEHNKGHHKRVGTAEDPATARYGESLYAFWTRSIVFSYFSAWHIAARECRRKGQPVISWKNEMLRYQLIQAGFILLIFLLFHWTGVLLFLAAAANGIVLLETVNYIEHYGLRRSEIAPGKYERAMPEHSWNSNHVIGRVMLFELSRHSDHHFMASRKYQLLRHHDNSPQMPTGYPGMMLLALVPPVWFRLMHARIRNLKKQPGVTNIAAGILSQPST